MHFSIIAWVGGTGVPGVTRLPRADVCEYFKCLEDVALNKAYAIGKEDGTWLTFNGTAKENGEVLSLLPEEAIISQVPLKLNADRRVSVDFSAGAKKRAPEKEI